MIQEQSQVAVSKFKMDDWYRYFWSSVMHRYKVIKSLCSKCWRNVCVDEYFEKVMVESSFDIYSPQLCAVFVCLPVL